MNAQIAKTYDDGSLDILTLPVDTARAHVATRTANAASFGLARITVRIGSTTHAWDATNGWAA
jgi:hypothetical protein